MATDEMIQPDTPPTSETDPALESKLDDTIDASPAPNGDGTGDGASEVQGLDDLLAEASASSSEMLSPLDEPDDGGGSLQDDLDTALSELSQANEPDDEDVSPSETINAAAALEPEPAPNDPVGDASIDDELDDALAEAAAPDGTVQATENETEQDPVADPALAEPEELYEDDPDETDQPTVFGDGASLYEDDEDDESAPDNPPASASGSPNGAPPSDPGTDATTATETKERPVPGPRPNPLAALAPIGAASVRAADLVASPLAKISPEKRELLGYFALVTLFNALAVFVVFVLFG